MSGGTDESPRVGEGGPVTEREWLGHPGTGPLDGDGGGASTVRPVTYLAGPMTGRPNFNYDMFHTVARFLRADDKWGRVVNPAENFAGIQTYPRSVYLHRAIKQVLDADHVVVLPDWEHSEGAKLEIAIAIAIDTPVYEFLPTRDLLIPSRVADFPLSPAASPKLVPAFTGTVDNDPDVSPLEPASIAQEAAWLVDGARQADYGHPFDDFSRTAQLWTAILGHTVTAEEVALCMVAVKLSREVNKPKRDNLVDAIGYVLTLDMVRKERENR